MSRVIHKAGPRKVEAYAGFGQYELVGTPLCAGGKAYWTWKKGYVIHRLWSKVTCKNCQKKGGKGAL